jgi:hypothetical protein
MKTQKWQVISLDVWGNARDGFELNAAYTTEHYAELPEGFGLEDVCRELERLGLIAKEWRRYKLALENLGENLVALVRQSRADMGLPLWHLERVK